MNMTTRPRLCTLLMALSTAGIAACGSAPLRSGGASSAGSPPPSTPDLAAEAPMDEDYAAGEAEAAEAPPPPAPGAASGADGQAWAARSRQAEAKAPDSREGAYEPAPVRPRHRPGLGTEWGESRYSRVTTAPFIRADHDRPFALAKLYYNDRAGLQAMLDTWGGSPSYRTRFAISGGHVEVSLRAGDGQFLSGFTAGGRDYVTGEAGQRYTIVIDNRTPGRIEAVVSVDGLDVVDGRSASYGKRGYLLEAHGHLEIDGFRRSESEVAAFRFGSVANSYAGRKHGNTRNVGVIGLAFFHEQGDSPSYWSQPWRYDEAHRRHSADPFPARYASPPN